MRRRRCDFPPTPYIALGVISGAGRRGFVRTDFKHYLLPTIFRPPILSRHRKRWSFSLVQMISALGMHYVKNQLLAQRPFSAFEGDFRPRFPPALCIFPGAISGAGRGDVVMADFGDFYLPTANSTGAVVQRASSSRRRMVGVFGMHFVLNHSGGALLRLFRSTTITYLCSHQHFVCDLSMHRRCIKRFSVLPGVRHGRIHDEHSESRSTMDWKVFIGAGD